MPRGHQYDTIYSHQYLCALFGPIFLYVFLEKDCNREKKNFVPCLDVIIAFFQINIPWSSLFARKARVNTERVPPGHPIILLKSNKFNMAAVSVKRSIRGLSTIIIPCGLVVRIRRSHRRSLGSIPGVGKIWSSQVLWIRFFLIFGSYVAVRISHVCYCFICSTGITLSTLGTRINPNR